jgi:hypothetical protein
MKNSNLRKILEKLSRKAYERKEMIFLAIGISIFTIMFFGFFKMVFFLVLLIILNIIVSLAMKNVPKTYASLELIMFSTVLIGTAYGPKAGAFFGLAMPLIFFYACGRISVFVFAYAPLYSIIGATAGMFSSYPILVVGMTYCVIYNLISSTILIVFLGGKVHRAFIFTLINTCWNLIIFKYLAPLFLSMM